MIPISIALHQEIENKYERFYADILFAQKIAGEIIDYRHQPFSFILTTNIKNGRNSVKYTPDFLVIYPKFFELLDIKAEGEIKNKVSKKGIKYRVKWTSMEDDARVKINMASSIFPWFKWGIIWIKNNRGALVWRREKVN